MVAKIVIIIQITKFSPFKGLAVASLSEYKQINSDFYFVFCPIYTIFARRKLK